MLVAVYDAKPYDRQSLPPAVREGLVEWRFLEFRLGAHTVASAEGADAVCVFVSDQIDRACLQGLKDRGVRLVALRCTGFNNVDVAAAKELKIPVTRVPVYSPYAVAEHAVALLLTLNRKVHRAYNRVREQDFSLNGLVGVDLHGKTAGVVGTGKIGKIVARILKGFGMEVLAYDPHADATWAAEEGVSYAPLAELMRRSDVVSLHVPLNSQTKYLIGQETLAAMKPGVILINVSRGGLVDTAALIAALKSGQVAGVGLDVYEEEEGIFFEDLSGEVLLDDVLVRLMTFPNVLITAHQAFLTREALSDIARTTADNLEALATGQPFVEGSVLT